MVGQKGKAGNSHSLAFTKNELGVALLACNMFSSSLK
jgi:hypothetical protein